MLNLTNEILKNIANIEADFDVCFGGIGNLSIKTIPDMLSWLISSEYVDELIGNSNVAGVITTKELSEKIPSHVAVIIHPDPMIPVSKLIDYQEKKIYVKNENEIHSSAKIHPLSYIADYNVKIEEGTVIEPFVFVGPSTKIGKGCIIRSGAVIGSDNFNKFRSMSGQITSSFSGNGVILGDEVEIGCNSCIDKGDSLVDTRIEKGTKIHNHTIVSHGAKIGSDCIIWGNVFICGFAHIGNNVQIQPGSVVSNHINIGDGAYVGLHSVVTQDLEPGKTYFGTRILQNKLTLNKLKEQFSK